MLLRECEDAEYLRKVVRHLYGLLDSIDSADDAAKSNDAKYRKWVQSLQAQKNESGVSSDGYTLFIEKVNSATIHDSVPDSPEHRSGIPADPTVQDAHPMQEPENTVKKLFKYRTRYYRKADWTEWSYIFAPHLPAVISLVFGYGYSFNEIQVELVSESVASVG